MSDSPELILIAFEVVWAAKQAEEAQTDEEIEAAIQRLEKAVSALKEATAMKTKH